MPGPDPFNQQIELLASLPGADSDGSAFVIDDYIYYMGAFQARYNWKDHLLYWQNDAHTIRNFWQIRAAQPGGSRGMPTGVDTRSRLWRVAIDNGFETLMFSTIYPESHGDILWTPDPGSVEIDQSYPAISYVYSSHTNSWAERDMVRPVTGAVPGVDSQGRVYATGGRYSQTLGWIELYFDDYDSTGGTGHTVAEYYYDSTITIDQTTATVERYSPASDDWNYIASMNQPREEHLVLVDSKDHVYVIGGHAVNTGSHSWENPSAIPTTNFTPYRPVRADAIRPHLVPHLPPIVYPILDITQSSFFNVQIPSVERYDPLTNTWTTLTSLSEPMSNEGNFQLVGAVDSEDRPVAAWLTLPNSFPDSAFIKSQRYDPQTDTWTQLPDLEYVQFTGFARLYISMGAHQNRVVMYVHTYNGNLFGGGEDGAWLYELSNDQWTAKAHMPGIVNSSMFVPFLMDPNDRFYIIGGTPPTPLSPATYPDPTERVCDMIMPRSCFNAKSKVLGPISVTQNTQEMVETVMPDVKVTITMPHFDPCHPQTQANPLRVDSQVWVRGPLDQKVKG